MEAQEILNDKLKREYKVCVPAAVINGKVENFLLNTGKTTRIKGYSRPGKVPMVVLRQRFLAEALNHVLPQVLKEGHDYLLNLFRVTPAHQPKYKVNQFGEGKDLEYTVTFEVLPEVPPIAWEKLHLVRYKPFVSNECVEKKLEQIAGECTASRPYPDDMHVAQKGDTVIVDAKLKLASGKGAPQKM